MEGAGMKSIKSGTCYSKPLTRSTQDVPIRFRRDHWREAVSAVFPSLAVDYASELPPRAWLESRSFADAQITRFIDHTPACHVVHTPSRLNWPEAYLLVLQIAGAGDYKHAQRNISVKSGNLALLDMGQRFELTFPKSHHELVWVLPRETLEPLLTSPERVGISLSGDSALGALLASTMRMLADGAGNYDTFLQKIFRLHLCNLAALTVGAAAPVKQIRSQTYRFARRQEIFAYIEAHLDDNNLSADKAARDLKMSKRWLYALFNEEEMSFAAWVSHRRIEECRKMLEDSRQDHLSISTIAFRRGFNDLSTFYRQFRAHYGLTPKDVRHVRPMHGNPA